MRKTILVFCLVLSLTFLAGCGKKEENNTGLKEQAKQTEGKISSTLRDLMKKGDAIKCEYSVAMEGFEQKNTLYISGEKMRMDGTTNIPGQKQITNHMINAEGYSYFWNEDGSGKGTKMKIEESIANEEDFENVQDQSMQMDLDTMIDMDCDKWKEDKNIFVPPSNISFDDFSEMMKNFQNYGQINY